MTAKKKSLGHGPDELLGVARSLNRPFQESAIKGHSALAKAFDSVAVPMWKFRIRLYCEHHGVVFNGKKAKCPMHVGHSKNLQFAIDEETNRWYCFGDCPPDPGKHYRSGSLLGLHTIACGFGENFREAYHDLFSPSPSPWLLPLAPTSLSCRGKVVHKARAKGDQKLIAQALAATEHVDEAFVEKRSVRQPDAFKFARFLLELTKGKLPVVFEVAENVPIVGGPATLKLKKTPDVLQYFCPCTAKTTQGNHQNRNMAEKLFLNIEFDTLARQKQLQLLWFLKEVKGWRLVSITFSGHESLHGLFLVLGMSADRIEAMKETAMKLGACKSCKPDMQIVRFPGGWNRKWKTRQRILYLNLKPLTRVNRLEKPPQRNGNSDV